jgi:hypothetical protein
MEATHTVKITLTNHPPNKYKQPEFSEHPHNDIQMGQSSQSRPAYDLGSHEASGDDSSTVPLQGTMMVIQNVMYIETYVTPFPTSSTTASTCCFTLVSMRLIQERSRSVYVDANEGNLRHCMVPSNRNLEMAILDLVEFGRWCSFFGKFLV